MSSQTALKISVGVHLKEVVDGALKLIAKFVMFSHNNRINDDDLDELRFQLCQRAFRCEQTFVNAKMINRHPSQADVCR